MTDIVTITMNPAIDLSTAVDRVEPTRKLRCTAPHRDPGGGGINVARVVRRLGNEVTAIYPAGGSIGRLLRRLADDQQISSIPIEVMEETREDFTALDESSGRQYRFVLPGPRLREGEWRRCLAALASIDQRPRFVVASGSLPPGPPDDFYARIVQVAADLGAKVVLDTSGPAMKFALDKGIYLLKPNLHELSELMQAPLDDQSAQIEACRRLVKMGHSEVIALTLGDQGALLVTRDKVRRARALPVKPVSTVGAGDSFLGAMVWALSCGQDIEEAFRYGIAAGSAALLTPGTELCHAADVKRLLPEVVIEPMTMEVSGR